MRWTTVEQADPGLFPVLDLFEGEHGTGRMSQLEFLPVLARSVLNRIPNGSPAPFRWTVNVYRGCSHACRYCFARPTHEYLDMSPGEDFDRRIVVKVNAVEVVRRELGDPRWARDGVAMGTNTDPYQRAEAKFRLTRGVIEALIAAHTPFSILTKSPLVTRDLDLLVAARDAGLDVRVQFSIPTVDEQAWRASEPGTPHPLRRVAALRTMVEAGIGTGAFVAPILPGISDSRAQITATVEAILATGARIEHAHPVYLRGSTRDVFLSWLLEHDPALHERYVRGLDARGETSPQYRAWVREAVARAVRTTRS